MSHEVSCPKCNTPNPLGSKFCNRCGTRLPPGDYILCPHCQTANLRDRFYCDNCGKRLVEDAPPSEPPRTGSRPSPQKFSLPQREAGDVADIDPDDLPEWLKTGNLNKPPDDAGAVESAEALPPLEEVAPLETTTDELPTWLVDDLASSTPGFQPPREITTDQFLELTRGEGDDDDLPEDVARAAAEAELPDWLTEPAPPTAQDADAPDAAPSAPMSPDEWLAELGPINTDFADRPDRPGPEPDLPEEVRLPDWLAELGPTQTGPLESDDEPPSGIFSTSEFADQVLGGEELPDWLDELGPAQTAELPDRDQTSGSDLFQSDEIAAEARKAMGSEELPDWLAELGPSQTTPLAEPEPPSGPEAAAGAEDEPISDAEWDWLTRAGLVDAEQSDEGEEDLFEGTSPELAQTDWFTDPHGDAAAAARDEIDALEAAADEIPAQPAAPEAAIPAAPADEGDDEAAGLTELLAAIGDAPERPEAAQTGMDEAVSGLEDLLAGIDAGAADEDTADEAAADAVDMATFWDGAADEVEADAAAAGITQWLAELDEEQPDEPAADAAAPAAEPGITRWLADLDEDRPADAAAAGAVAAEESPTAEPGMTEWLAGLDDDQPADAAAAGAAAAEDEPVAESSMTQWLDGLDQEPAAATAADQAEEMADEVDWLTELGPAYTGPLTDDQEQPAPAAADAPVEVPEWLDELGPTQTGLLAGATEAAGAPADQETGDADQALVDEIISFDTDEADELLPDWLVGDASPEDLTGQLPAWTGEDEAAAAELEEAPPADEAAAAEDDDALPFDDPTLTQFEPDWLTEFATLGPDAFLEEAPAADVAAEEAAPADAASPAEPAAVADHRPPPQPGDTFWAGVEPAEPVAADDEEPDSVFDEFDLTGELDGEIPEWITQLGPPVAAESTPPPAVEEDEGLIVEDIPEWLSQYRPDTSEGEAGASPGLAAGSLLDAELSDLPEELAGAQLPDWLQDISVAPPAAETGQALAAESPDSAGEAAGEKGRRRRLARSDSTATGDLTAELSALLDQLPPAPDPAADLVPAELPEWIQALKPRAMTAEEAAAREAERPLQESGPLSGIRGVLEIETVVAASRTGAVAGGALTVSKEQQQHAVLLRQLSVASPAPQSADVAGAPGDLSRLGRTAVALLLLAALLAGLLGPTLIRDAPLAPLASPAAAQAAVAASAGRPVLLAIDYTPAMAAELTPAVTALLDQMVANDSLIIPVSQHAAGVGLARQWEQLASTPVTFVPGEAIGLRELGRCLNAPCATLSARSLDGARQQQLQAAAIIVVATADRDSLVNWIEQVGSTAQRPVLAVVTQGLAPVAAPYADTGQLAGVIAGVPDSVGPDSERLLAQLNAQHLAQVVAVLLLLAGAVMAFLPGDTGAGGEGPPQREV